MKKNIDILLPIQKKFESDFYTDLAKTATEKNTAGIAIKNVTVFNAAEGSTFINGTVLIKDNIIEKVGNSTNTKIPAGYKVIDGTNKFLMPGLWEMHAHFFIDDGPLMMARGVTNLRDMGNGEELWKLKERIETDSILVDEKNAVVWRGPMASSAIRQFVTDVFWGDLDYLVVDMPPGTGDIHLTLVQTVPVTGVVIVTTPQDVALADAKKGIAMFGQAQVNVPIIGLVENMSYFTPAELPNNKYYIFGKGGGKRLAEEYDLPFLGQIPLVQSIREGGDQGVPIMMSDDEITKKAFEEFAGTAVRSIAMRNAQMPKTTPLEMVNQ